MMSHQRGACGLFPAIERGDIAADQEHIHASGPPALQRPRLCVQRRQPGGIRRGHAGVAAGQRNGRQGLQRGDHDQRRGGVFPQRGQVAFDPLRTKQRDAGIGRQPELPAGPVLAAFRRPR